MPQFNDNIRRLATQNTDFRREILTNQHSQLVLMSIEPGDEIGEAKRCWTERKAASKRARW